VSTGTDLGLDVVPLTWEPSYRRPAIPAGRHQGRRPRQETGLLRARRNRWTIGRRPYV